MKKWSARMTGFAAAVLLLAALTVLTVDGKAAGNTATITFHAGGGYGNVPEPITVSVGENAVIPAAQLTCPAPGWLFTGWSFSVSSNVEYCPGDAITLMEDVILYAVYTPNACTVEYRIGDAVMSEQVLPGGTPQEIPDLSGSGYTAWTNSEGRRTDLDGTQIWRGETFMAVPDSYIEPVTLNTSATHTSYMNGYDDGLFRPNAALTRAELAQILYALIEERPPASQTYSDVNEAAWYAPAINTLSALNILNGDGSGLFHPERAVTRAECAAVLSRVLPANVSEEMPFLDIPEDFWAYSDIARVCGYGLFRGDGSGNFYPNNSLTRAEAVTAFNRLMGRSADNAALTGSNTLRIFPDVPTAHWAYRDVMEASTSHVDVSGGSGGESWSSVAAGKTSLADGFYPVDGQLYYAQGGRFLYNTSLGSFTFDQDGRLGALPCGFYSVNNALYYIDRNGNLVMGKTLGAYTASAAGVLTQTASAYQMPNVPYISQIDNISAWVGCEATAALAGLQAKGYATGVSLRTFLDNLPRATSDPEKGFVGSPYVVDRSKRTTIYPAKLAEYCNTYCNGDNVCSDFRGASLEELRRELLAGNCVVAYMTLWWKNPVYSNYNIEGQTQRLVSNNHAVLVCGYDPQKGYFVSDPYNYYNRGQVYQYWVDAQTFDPIWNERKVGMLLR